MEDPEDGRVSSGEGCEQQRFILSNEVLPIDKCSYFEVLKNHTSGCYDSLGVCKRRVVGTRNGKDANGWAVRLYGNHGDFSFTGKIHNGVSDSFHDTWGENTRVGVLYNPAK